MKTETKHTPAMRQDSRLPWRWVFEEGHWTVWTRADDTPGSQNNYVIADNIQEESEAKLIAAAPELLEALQQVMCDNKELGAISRPSGDQARAAITKATI